MKNNKYNNFYYYLFDWANSPFSTIIIAHVLPRTQPKRNSVHFAPKFTDFGAKFANCRISNHTFGQQLQNNYITST